MQTESKLQIKHHCICSNTLFTWGIAKVQIVICWSNQMSLTTFKMPTHVGHKNLSRNILVKEQTSVSTLLTPKLRSARSGCSSA